MDSRTHADVIRPAPRHRLPLRVQRCGDNYSFHYQAPRLLPPDGVLIPMVEYCIRPEFAGVIVKVLEAFRDLEREMDPLLKEREELLEKNSVLEAKVKSLDGMIDMLKGQATKTKGKANGH